MCKVFPDGLFYLVNSMRMSLQSKSLVGKEISSLKPRLRLGFRGRNFFADLGLGLQRYIASRSAITQLYIFSTHCAEIAKILSHFFHKKFVKAMYLCSPSPRSAKEFLPRKPRRSRGLREEISLPTKGLDCKDIPISLLNRKIREIMCKNTI